MKIKKFTCRNCGAPKVNAYTLPYIVCDFCGCFTDIDFAVAMEAWNADEKKTNAYEKQKRKIENSLNELLINKDRLEYTKLQFDYWNMYYKMYPEYLPPSIDKPDEYSAYLNICAKYSTDYAFENPLKHLEEKYKSLQS
jgi:hypothetical protein